MKLITIIYRSSGSNPRSERSKRELVFPEKFDEIILLLYTISMMESESLFIVDDSPDNRLENARRQAPSNGPIILNKFEGAQMEHDRRIQMTETSTQAERAGMAQKKHDYRIRKPRNDNNESRQAELDAECQRKPKSRRLAKEELNIKYMGEREALIEKVNQRYRFIFMYTNLFQDP